MNCTNNNFTSTILPILNSTLSNDLTFIEILTNSFLYGSSIIFIFLLLCVITLIFILKSKKKHLFSTNI